MMDELHFYLFVVHPSLSLSIESTSQNETFCVIFKHCDILYKSTVVPTPDKCQLS